MNHKTRLCADISKANGEDPIGTASPFDDCLLIELSPPWSRHVWESSQVAETLRLALQKIEALGRNVKMLAIQPDAGYSQPGLRRVIHYRRPDAAFARYEKREYCLPDALVPALIEDLFAAPQIVAPFDAYKQPTTQQRDLLVCTHGSRDSCCGKYGIPLYDVLRKTTVRCDGHPIRVWRVSHIGGHRLAATMLDLPYGHYWGHVPLTALPTLLEHRGAVADLQPFYRGWAGVSKIVQVAERAIWQREGWAWLAYHKAGRHRQRSDSQTEVDIDYCSADGQKQGHYTAVVEVTGQVETLSSSGDEEFTLVDQYAVRSLIHNGPN